MRPRLGFRGILLTVFFAMATAALASTTWYIDGVNGNDGNNCLSPTTACKTIGRAISLASSGDSVSVAAATYTENLRINISLKLIGAGAATTIIDGGAVNTVVTVSSATAKVFLSKFTIQNGSGANGGGIDNGGMLTINTSTVSGNSASSGGGIYNTGTLTINKSTVSGNGTDGFGGGIDNFGSLTINGSTISGNKAEHCVFICTGYAGGINNEGTLVINNSTISGNSPGLFGVAGGIADSGSSLVTNSTITGNTGGGIDKCCGSPLSIQNSIIANNGLTGSGPNCNGTITSLGYNLSSDGTCNFSGPGDLNNTDPMLGPLQNNGGPTLTQALLSGSPAIDAGNPNGCTDGSGHLLKTDQRGSPRPDKEDTGGCDMGAYESQTD